MDETVYLLDGGKLVVELDCELDHHNAAMIRESIDYYIISEGARYVVFDFASTTFMDSSGIGVIMGRQKILEGLGGLVFVRNMGKEIRRIFTLSGLHKIVGEEE